MEPLFYVQIVDRTGVVARIPGGGPLERDLLAACEAAIVAKGVGMFKTEAQVRAAIREGLSEVLRGLKSETRWLVK